MNVKEEDFSYNYRDIIRRLQKAVSEPEMRDKMEIEDDIVEQFEERERLILLKEEIIEEKVKVINEKDKEIEALKLLLKKTVI